MLGPIAIIVFMVLFVVIIIIALLWRRTRTPAEIDEAKREQEARLERQKKEYEIRAQMAPVRALGSVATGLGNFVGSLFGSKK